MTVSLLNETSSNRAFYLPRKITLLICFYRAIKRYTCYSNRKVLADREHTQRETQSIASRVFLAKTNFTFSIFRGLMPFSLRHIVNKRLIMCLDVLINLLFACVQTWLCSVCLYFVNRLQCRVECVLVSSPTSACVHVTLEAVSLRARLSFVLMWASGCCEASVASLFSTQRHDQNQI